MEDISNYSNGKAIFFFLEFVTKNKKITNKQKNTRTHIFISMAVFSFNPKHELGIQKFPNPMVSEFRQKKR